MRSQLEEKLISIVILSFNTSEMTIESLNKLFDNLVATNMLGKTELIIIDNASIDNSVPRIKEFVSSHQAWEITPIYNSINLGFGKANNQGFKIAKGKFVLIYNSDVIPSCNLDFNELCHFLDINPKVGAISVKVLLENGDIDPASHRGFPTLWRSISYFLGLEKLTKKIPYINKIFGGYHLTWQDLDATHEIESGTGAFLLIRSEILQKLNGFDEQYFFYGEDLDLCLEMHYLGYKIVYFPSQQVFHFKYQSGLKSNKSSSKSKAKYHFYEAMWIFYNKHYSKNHSNLFNSLLKKIILIRANRYL